jgi:hypothetical protein
MIEEVFIAHHIHAAMGVDIANMLIQQLGMNETGTKHIHKLLFLFGEDIWIRRIDCREVAIL